MSITLDHVGLLVRNIDETIEFYSRILGLNKTEKTVDNVHGQEQGFLQ